MKLSHRAALAAATLSAAVVATSPLGAASAPAEPAGKPASTQLTVAIAGCEGCAVQLHQAVKGPRGVRPWASRTATVTGGVAVLDVASRRTFGSTMTLKAPWEGQLGYLTTVVMRYPGNAPGDNVDAAEAASANRANPCWEGARSAKARLDVAVEQVQVAGVHGEVAGTRAWLPTTTVWTGDARHAPRGVLGTQDPDVCRG